jgi:hypothetical protein
MALPTRRQETWGVHEPNQVARAADTLIRDGCVHLKGRRLDWAEAKRDSLQIFAKAIACDPMAQDSPGLNVIGEIIAPPPGSVQRNFQPLHIDFGLPFYPQTPVDVARFTVLHVDRSQASSGAATQIVGLSALLSQREWPARAVVANRLYSSADSEKPVEGILGRIIECVDEGTSLLSTMAPGFLCGMEFCTIEEERSYFCSHGMDLSIERRIVLGQHEVLLIDNLHTAHGRIGRRRTNELHQVFVGYRSLTQVGQRVLLDRVLAGFE